MDADKTNNNGTVSSGDAPQKYIRTFAGDVAVIQKGGMPDLAPLTPNAATASPEAVAPVAPPAPPAPSWDEKVREETLARLRAKVAEKVAEPPPVRVQAPPPVIVEQQRAPEVAEVLPPPPVVRQPRVVVEEVPLETPSPIHTYSADFSDELKEKRASTATVLAAEQDAAPLSAVEQEPRESGLRKAVFLSIGAVLIAGGGAGAYYAYTIYANARIPVFIAPVISAPIAVEEQKEISGEGVALLRAISQSAGEPLSVGSVRQLYSTNATTTRRSIFVMMRPQAPDILLRNISGAKSMAGIINVGNGEAPFFILSVSSYNDSFAGMLSWESTMANMLTSLYPPYPTLALAPPVPVPPVSATSATSKGTSKKTTTSTTNVPTATSTVAVPPVFLPSFRDETIANHDVRVYRDALGQSILLYGYWNQTTLIIARDAAAFTEILRRLANTRS